MKNRFENLFATTVLRGALANASALNKKLLVEIEQFSSQDKMGREWSRENYQGGYTSYGSLSDMHHRAPSFADLESALEPQAMAFAKKQGWSLRGMELQMTACWINIMPAGSYHTLHLHPGSVISGTYYVSSPPGSVSLKIEDPRMGFYMNAPVRQGQSLYYEVAPTPGSFVLFESWLRHEVPPNRSKQPRISVSFNYGLEAREA